MAFEIGSLLGAFSILMFLSWLFFRRNPAFDIAEAIFVGSAAAFNFIIGIKAVRDNAVYPLLAGDWRILIPIILSIVLYLQLNTKTMHYARIPIAIIIGVGIGLSVRKELLAGVIATIRASTINFAKLDALSTVNNIIILFGFITAFLYFIMSKEQTGMYGKLTRVGRIFLMITFGSIFGGALMAGVGVIGGRVFDILRGFGLI